MKRLFARLFRRDRLYEHAPPTRNRTVRRAPGSRRPQIRARRFSLSSLFSGHDSTTSRPALRLRIAGLTTIVLFGLLALRLWSLQVVQASAFAHAVSANQVRVVPIDPTRGDILDRNGVPLANNVVNETITLSRAVALQHPKVIGRLAALLGQTTTQINQTIASKQNSPYAPIPILADAPLPDILFIKEHPAEFPGVAVAQSTQRNYPQLSLPVPPGAQGGYPASQTLGYVGQINSTELKSLSGKGYLAGDQIGQSGLEAQYESALHGTPGSQKLEVDAQGQVVGTLKTKPAVPGDNVVTNIDLGLEQVADAALANQIMALRQTVDTSAKPPQRPAATGGAVVVMNPQTGAVLALSSYPSYNPSIWVNGISTSAYASLQSPASNQPLINRGIGGLYTPGSTFKLATATAALDDGLITANTPYNDTGIFTVPNCKGTSCSLHNAGNEALGVITVQRAIASSDDAFFYNLGAMFYQQSANPAYGQTPIQNMANQYSYGQLTGIDLPGESTGRVDSQAERLKLHQLSPTAFPTTTWYTGDSVELAFGQGATVVTPIEQAVAYATFANGGTRYAPQVAEAIVSPSGRVIQRIAPRVTGHVNLPPSTRNPMLAGFEGAVQSPVGTAYTSFQGSAFPVNELAGKTGTADTEIGKEPTAWFVGWGPVANPQYVVVCVIDQAGYGVTAAAPVVRQVFDYLAAHPIGPAAVPPTGPADPNVPVPLPTTPGSPTATTTPPASTTPTTTTPTTTPTATTAPATTAPNG